MRCGQNWLFNKEIRSFIFVPVILRTFNVGTKTNQNTRIISMVNSSGIPYHSGSLIF